MNNIAVRSQSETFFNHNETQPTAQKSSQPIFVDLDALLSAAAVDRQAVQETPQLLLKNFEPVGFSQLSIVDLEKLSASFPSISQVKIGEIDRFVSEVEKEIPSIKKDLVAEGRNFVPADLSARIDAYTAEALAGLDRSIMSLGKTLKESEDIAVEKKQILQEERDILVAVHAQITQVKKDIDQAGNPYLILLMLLLTLLKSMGEAATAQSQYAARQSVLSVQISNAAATQQVNAAKATLFAAVGAAAFAVGISFAAVGSSFKGIKGEIRGAQDTRVAQASRARQMQAAQTARVKGDKGKPTAHAADNDMAKIREEANTELAAADKHVAQGKRDSSRAQMLFAITHTIAGFLSSNGQLGAAQNNAQATVLNTTAQAVQSNQGTQSSTEQKLVEFIARATGLLASMMSTQAQTISGLSQGIRG